MRRFIMATAHRPSFLTLTWQTWSIIVAIIALVALMFLVF